MDSLIGLQIAQGSMANMNPLFKFGENRLVDTSLETVWDGGGLYSYITQATRLSVTSDSTSDTNQDIFIQGLDADYNEISETVGINGRNEVLTQNTYLRVYRAFYVSGSALVGDVYIGSGNIVDGVPVNKYAIVKADRGQTQMAVYTVPAGYTMYVSQGHIGSGDNTGNRFVTGQFRIRTVGASQWRVIASTKVQNNTFYFEFGIPQAVPEKTDIEATAISSSGSMPVVADWTAVLVKNS